MTKTTSNRILQLPPDVAERIAASEVIERPGSVVKELVENSLDAGAKKIRVTLVQGGLERIEVEDDGHGINSDDLGLAISRHATSKLRSLADLEALFSLGFRGEALASIAAAADLEITSRVSDSDVPAFHVKAGSTPGLRTEVVPQAITRGPFLGSKHGTTVKVERLFAQIPARLKFMRTPQAEMQVVREWLERVAMGHPQVGFELVSGSRTVLNLPPGDFESRFKLLWCKNDTPILTSSVDIRGTGTHRLSVYWAAGLAATTSRSVVQVLNGRALRDRGILQAVLAPFRQSVLPGMFPTLALVLDLPPSEVDFNVHPTKQEVRFLHSSALFGAIHKFLADLIASSVNARYVGHAPQNLSTPSAPKAPLFAPENPPDTRHNTNGPTESLEPAQVAEARRGSHASEETPGLRATRPVLTAREIDLANDAAENTVSDNQTASLDAQPSEYLGLGSGIGPGSAESLRSETNAGPARDLSGSLDRNPATNPGQPSHTGQTETLQLSPSVAQSPLLRVFQQSQWIGPLFATYLAWENSDELVLLDQHAADERVRYEHLQSRVAQQRLENQQLLFPEVVHLNESLVSGGFSQLDSLNAAIERLNHLGFELEPFGGNTVVFRAIPVSWELGQSLRARLETLLNRALEASSDAKNNGTPTFDAQLFESLASAACKASVRAGQRLTQEDADALLKSLAACEHPWNCPHGRATVVRIPRARFEEWFQRKL